jgi:hypothetical protein
MNGETGDTYCVQCQRTLTERQLRMKSLTVESCPYCNTVVRQSEGFRSTNLDAIIMEDVAAIDAWLDGHAKAAGVQIDQQAKDGGERNWTFLVDGSLRCEVVYSPHQTSIIQVRLVTDKGGEEMFEEPRRVQIVAATQGVQPHGSRQTNGMTGTVVCRWGATQYLSTNTLCEELFEPVIARLRSAVESLKKEFKIGND